MQEIDPLCALDFFVAETSQRKGVGRSLVDAMLQAEGCDIKSVAWDKPTEKSLALLAKHYQLNNFVF